MKAWFLALSLLGVQAVACPDLRGVYQCLDGSGPFILHMWSEPYLSTLPTGYQAQDPESVWVYQYGIERDYDVEPYYHPDNIQITAPPGTQIAWQSASPFVASVSSAEYMPAAGFIEQGLCFESRVSRYVFNERPGLFISDWHEIYSETFFIDESGYALTFEREYYDGRDNMAECYRAQ